MRYSMHLLSPRCPFWGLKGVAVVSEIEWPEQTGGMAVEGFHAHADLLDGGTATACGSVAHGQPVSQPWPFGSQSLIKVMAQERHQSAGMEYITGAVKSGSFNL